MSRLTNIEFFAGEDIELEVTLSPAVNITTWTLTFTLKESLTAASALVTKTVGSGITITDGANGIFVVSLPAASTNQTARKYVYDIWKTNSGGSAVLCNGQCNIKARVKV